MMAMILPSRGNMLDVLIFAEGSSVDMRDFKLLGAAEAGPRVCIVSSTVRMCFSQQQLQAAVHIGLRHNWTVVMHMSCQLPLLSCRATQGMHYSKPLMDGLAQLFLVRLASIAPCIRVYSKQQLSTFAPSTKH